MSLHLIWKRLITKEVPLSSNPTSIAMPLLPPLAFNAKPIIKITHFCTQTAAPSTTPPDWGIFREFLLNKCGFREEDITKAYGHRNGLLRKSMQNLEEVLELLYSCRFTTPVQIRTVVLRNPGVFFYKSETKVKTMLNLLRTFMKEEHVSKLVYNYSTVFSSSEHRVKSAISLLQKQGVEGEFLSVLLAFQPRFLTSPEEKVLESFKQAEYLGVKKGSKAFVAALRAVFGLAWRRGMIPRYRVMEALKSMQVLKTEINWPRVFKLSERSFLEKYVNSNAESSSVLRGIYHSGKAGKVIIDKEK